MGRLAKILSFIRVIRNDAKVSDVKIDPGGGANVTVEHFAPPGDDSYPLDSDYVATMGIPRTGGEVAVGYVDPLNTPKANQGDKRIYARDANTGAVVVEVWLKNDGTAIVSNDEGSATLQPDGGTIVTTPNSTFDAAADGSIKGDNGSGSFELQSGGDFVVNGVTIDISGNIIAPANVTAVGTVGAAIVAATTGLTVAGKEMSGHTHSQGNDSNGDSQVDTNGPV